MALPHIAIRLVLVAAVWVCVAVSQLTAAAQESEPGPEASPRSDAVEIAQAIERGFAVIGKGVANYPKHRDCFSCHHQALPIVAASLQHRTSPATPPADFADAEMTKSILAFTEESFAPRIAMMREGTGVGGRSLTAAYGLWTLDSGGAPRNATSDAMVEYLLQNQAEDGGWEFQSHRPPAASSRMMTTAIATYGLRAYGFDIVEPARQTEWLGKAARFAEQHSLDGSHEELVGALWLDQMLLHEYALDTETATRRMTARTQELWSRQQADGGWSQIAELSSDPYSTGQALLMLTQLGDSPALHREERYQKAIRYLLNAQEADGSWHVVTRAKPVQVYFDNGDPHGKDQFISMMATCWSTAALANFQSAGQLPLESPQVARRSAAQ